MKGVLCGSFFIIECSVADDGNHCSPSIVKLPTYHSSVLLMQRVVVRGSSHLSLGFMINNMLRKLLIIGNGGNNAIVHCCNW